MKSFKTLVQKLLSTPEAAPGQQPKQATLPSEIKMPAELVAELFPERSAMVSVLFETPSGTDAPKPVEASKAAKVPQRKPMTSPEELSIPDELMEAVFPKQKVMVSVLFNGGAPTLVTPELETEHGFPIL